MALSKIMKENLDTMDGIEMHFRDWGIIQLNYPYVRHNGKRIYFGEKRWREVYYEYWKNPNNEGYWLLKDARREFGF